MSDEPEMLFGDIPFISANREPCIICGHPTGDCSTESSPPKQIFGATRDFGSSADEQKILVEKDIIEVKQITPFTKSRVLVARKGSHITIAKAKELGII